MMLSRVARASAVVVALATAPTVAHAQFAVYTDQASFLAAVGNYVLDGFDGFSVAGTTPAPINRGAGVFAYTASIPGSDDFFGAGSAGDPWLSTNTATDPIIFSNFNATIVAIGGNFFTSTISGLYQLGDIRLTATNGDGSVVQTIINSQTSSFLGFVGLSSLTSLEVASVQPTQGFLWPTVEDLIIAQADEPTNVVPEPATMTLLATGLAGLAASKRRRKTAA